MRRDESSFLFGIGSLLLLFVRGLLLFAVVPCTLIAWMAVAPFMSRPRPSFGQTLGWADINVTSVVQRSLLRPFFIEPLVWVPRSGIRGVDHRVGIFDFF